MNRQLTEIARQLKAHQLDEARLALDSYLEAHPKDAWAWYLLSFAMPGKDEKIAAIQRALTLNATHVKIRARLRQLQGTGGKSRRWGVFVLLAVLLVLIVGAVFIVLSGSRNQDNLPIPTLAVLAAPTDTTVVVTDATTGQTETEMTSPQPTNESLAAATEGESGSPTPEALQNNVGGLTPTANPPQVVSPLVATPTSFTNISPANPTATRDEAVLSPTSTVPLDENQPTATTSPSTSTPPITASQTPPLTPVVDPGVPLNTSADIGIGEMRVIDAARPGETRIRELGGTIPAAPANQAWVLVEVLVACREQTTCSLSPSVFQVIGSSGTAYNPSSQLNMTPIFGSLTSNRQIWGYLGFIIPNNESGLRLALAQGSQTHLFALQ
jgi:hypothetical protein